MTDPFDEVEFEFADNQPDPEDADRIGEQVITNAIGEIFPETFQSLHAEKRRRRLYRLCQYYIWFDRNCDLTSTAEKRRQKSMEMVVAEFDDTDENRLRQSIYQAYEDRAEGDNALTQLEADLESLAVTYEAKQNQS